MANNEQTKPCPWCNRPTFDSYSEKRAVMYGDGYEVRHFVARQVGSGDMLGPVECPEGQMGDNGGVFNKAVTYAKVTGSVGATFTADGHTVTVRRRS